MDRPSVLIEVKDALAIVSFNQPAKRNSLSLFTLNELNEAVANLSKTSALIFTGTGETFASGADISELLHLDAVSALRFSKFGQTVFQRIADAQQVTIAAVNGPCLGGALDLALACDIRVASNNAVFAHPGARRGIITGWGGTQRLPRLIGRSKALEMMLTAQQIDARQALRIGLITSICDPALPAAIDVARAIQRNTAPERVRRR